MCDFHKVICRVSDKDKNCYLYVSSVTTVSKNCHFSAYILQCFSQNMFCYSFTWGNLRTSSSFYKAALFPFYTLGKLLRWTNLPKFTKELSDKREKITLFSPSGSKSNTLLSQPQSITCYNGISSVQGKITWRHTQRLVYNHQGLGGRPLNQLCTQKPER